MTDRLTQLFRFLDLDPTDAFTRYSIAYEYRQLAQWALAAEHFEALLAQHPNYVGAYYHLGHTYLRLKELDKATQIFNAGIEYARKNNDAHAQSELRNALTNLELGLDLED